MKERLVIVGIGSHSEDVVDFVQKHDLFDIVCFTVDREYIVSNEYMGKPVYPFEDLEKYVDPEDVKVFIAISWFNYMNKYKRQKFEQLKARGFHFANLISPLAVVNCTDIGEGNWIQPFVVIGFDSKIGDNNTICAQSQVGHHTIIGNHNVLAGRASIAGRSVIGNQNFLGFCSVVFNELTIGDMNLIGGGAIVKHSLPDCTITTAPDSHTKKATKKSLEFIISPKGVEVLKTLG